MIYKSEEVGNRLRSLRKNYGFSREKIAESIGRSPKYYADIERGSCGMSIETLMELAEVYQVSLDYLVHGQTEEKLDERTKWAIRRLTGLERRQREIVIEMVSLMLEQVEAK